MLPNFYVIAACALIPFFTAYIWFHPKAFGGDTWKNLANLTDQQNDKKITALQLLASILLNFLIAFGVFVVTVHGTHVLSMTGPDVDAFKDGAALAFMQEYGAQFHTLQHGITHGMFMVVPFFVLPILGYAMIFERKTFKYLFVNLGFWLISVTIMAVIISRWGGIPVY